MKFIVLLQKKNSKKRLDDNRFEYKFNKLPSF